MKNGLELYRSFSGRGVTFTPVANSLIGNVGHLAWVVSKIFDEAFQMTRRELLDVISIVGIRG